MEQRKDVVGYEGLYQVSDTGQVRSLDRVDGRGRHWKGRVLAQSINTSGYLCVNLSIDGKQTLKYIHRLVAEAFIPNPDNRPQVNHMDGNKQNNHVSNLEWATAKENMRHATETGLRDYEWMKGTKHPKAKLTDDDVRFIRHNYKSHDKQFGGKQLMEKFGISKNTLHAVLIGKTWTHIA